MGQPQGLFAELAKWRDKAEKRGADCTFTSEIIPSWLHAEVKAALGVVGLEAFSFLKQTPEERLRQERRLARQIEEELAEFEDEAARAAARNEEPDYDRLGVALAALFIPFLTHVAVQEAMRVSVDVGIEFDPAIISREALSWARTYSYDLIRGLTATTRGVVSEAMGAYLQTPGMGKEGLRALLEPAFGKVRAEMIATTETTRAYSAATNEYQRLTQQAGITVQRIWETQLDERVCDVCGPLDGKPESVWAAQFPQGPPAHVRCRCGLNLVTV